MYFSVYQCICCSVKLLVQKDMEVARGRGKTSHLYCSAAGGTFSPLEEEPHHQHHGQHHHRRPQNHYYCQDCFAMDILNNMKTSYNVRISWLQQNQCPVSGREKKSVSCLFFSNPGVQPPPPRPRTTSHPQLMTGCLYCPRKSSPRFNN